MLIHQQWYRLIKGKTECYELIQIAQCISPSLHSVHLDILCI